MAEWAVCGGVRCQCVCLHLICSSVCGLAVSTTCLFNCLSSSSLHTHAATQRWSVSTPPRAHVPPRALCLSLSPLPTAAHHSRPNHPHSAAIEELSDSSDCSSDGAVDEVIQHSQEGGDADSSITAYGFDASLFSVAARLLKSPGVQREIVQAALSDPEVFDILAGKMDLVSVCAVCVLGGVGVVGCMRRMCAC